MALFIGGLSTRTPSLVAAAADQLKDFSNKNLRSLDAPANVFQLV